MNGIETQRFWARVERSDGCWNWRGKTNRDGYGHFTIGSRTDGTNRKVEVHRLAYQLSIGPIPEGLTIDHLCRNHACVNPAHLEAVPLRINILRGTSPSAIHAKKTSCCRGHPFDLFNTYFAPDGARECRICRKASR